MTEFSFFRKRIVFNIFYHSNKDPFILLNATMPFISVIHLMHVINLWYGGKVSFLVMAMVPCWIYWIYLIQILLAMQWVFLYLAQDTVLFHFNQ